MVRVRIERLQHSEVISFLVRISWPSANFFLLPSPWCHGCVSRQWCIRHRNIRRVRRRGFEWLGRLFAKGCLPRQFIFAVLVVRIFGKPASCVALRSLRLVLPPTPAKHLEADCSKDGQDYEDDYNRVGNVALRVTCFMSIVVCMLVMS